MVTLQVCQNGIWSLQWPQGDLILCQKRCLMSTCALTHALATYTTRKPPTTIPSSSTKGSWSQNSGHTGEQTPVRNLLIKMDSFHSTGQIIKILDSNHSRSATDITRFLIYIMKIRKTRMKFLNLTKQFIKSKVEI